jgi:probable HAF family extracellular repeat protein
MNDLGGSYSEAYGINDAGQVVGYSETASGETHAFVAENGVMTDLGTLGGAYSYANGINNAGQVVGGASIASGDFHAFLWKNGEMTDLGTLGGSFSEAYGVNDTAQVVGWSDTASGELRAFLWENGVMADLNSLLDPADAAVWTLTIAYAINDAGQIVGTGLFGDQDRAFLLTPVVVPLPAAIWLMASALLGLVGLSRGRDAALARG